MNLNNFTIKSQEAIHKGQDMAQSYGHQAIETGHLLKGVLEVDENVIRLLKEWSSINHYIFGSFEEGDPVWYSVGGFVWESVWYSIGNSIWKSVAESVKSSTWYSVRNFIYVYIGSLFTNIKKWGDVQQKQSGVCLWKLGFVPSYNGKVWRLYSGENAKIVWEGEL